MIKKSLSTPRMFGYATGIVSESVLYNMYFTYFLIFMTDVAYVAPALAGTISLIAVSMDAVIDPVIGYTSDRKGVDKRKYLLIAAVPMGVMIMASFFSVDFSDGGKFIYYTLITIVFWLCYTTYTIPYYALGAEITDDYDERTKIRGISSFINGFAIFIGSAGPQILVSVFMGGGSSANTSWLLAAVVLGSLGTIVALTTYLSIRKVNLVRSESADENEGVGILKTYGSIIKLKPFKWLIVFVFFYLAGSSISQANVLYLIQYRVGLSPDAITFVLIVTVAGMFVFVPIVTAIAAKTDRRTVGMIFFSVQIIGLVIMKIVGVDSMLLLLIQAGVAVLGTAAFWTIFYPLAYDLVEVDELVNNKRREGAITSFPQFIQKIGSAFGMQVAGLTLTIVGYNAADHIQSEATALGIESISTLVLAGFVFVALLALIKYPVTKEKFKLVQEALEKKRNGEEFSTEFLKGII